MTDLELLRMLQDSPQDGYAALLAQYSGLVYTIVRGKLSAVGNELDIEDLVSEVFYVFYSNLEQVNLERGSVKAFLSVIAKRRAITKYHALFRHTVNTVSTEEIVLDTLTDTTDDAEQVVLQREAHKELLDALDALGEPDRTILIRKFYLGETAASIAEQVQLKQKTVEKRAERAIAKLRIRLKGGAV